MFLLFHVGLEVKASDLMRVGGTALKVAIAGVVLPFVLGWLISALGRTAHRSHFHWSGHGRDQRGHHGSCPVGQGPASGTGEPIIMAAAVIDDVLGLMVLAR